MPVSSTVVRWNNMYVVQLYYQCMHFCKARGWYPGLATLSFPANSTVASSFFAEKQWQCATPPTGFAQAV